MSAHTFGPLRIRVASNGDVAVMQGVSIVAECFVDIRHGTENAREEARANAILYVAASDLLAAAEAVLADCGDIDTESRLTLAVGRQLRAAIEKATIQEIRV